MRTEEAKELVGLTFQLCKSNEAEQHTQDHQKNLCRIVCPSEGTIIQAKLARILRILSKSLLKIIILIA